MVGTRFIFMLCISRVGTMFGKALLMLRKTAAATSPLTPCTFDFLRDDMHRVACVPTWVTAKLARREHIIAFGYVDNVFGCGRGVQFGYNVAKADRPVCTWGVVSGFAGFPNDKDQCN